MEPVNVQLLGGLSLKYQGRTLPPLPTRTARSLLGFLLVNRELPHPREWLAGTFWPDLPETRARRRLSHALWQIQQTLAELPAPLIVLTADTVRIGDQVNLVIDVEEFERLGSGTVEETEEAIDLYRGDLLAGTYDDWLVVEQQRVRSHYSSILRRSIDQQKARGAVDVALSHARRLVTHNPLDEEAQREVMRLCYLLGQFNDAIRQYEFCKSIIEEELNSAPEPETTALFEMIVDERSKGRRPFVPALGAPLFSERDIPMVGRSAERGAVIDRMARAFDGHGGAILVEGLAGMGVTRLLRHLAEDAHWRGLGVIEGRAGRVALPYGLIRSALGVSLTPLRVEQLTAVLDQVWLNAASSALPELGHKAEWSRWRHPKRPNGSCRHSPR